MKSETELLEELSRRASVPVTTVRAVVDALRDEVRSGRGEILMASSTDRARGSDRSVPANHADPREVDELIDRASRHRLGLEFLLDGYLGSVAAEFGAHAFTVEAARAHLRNQQRKAEDAS